MSLIKSPTGKLTEIDDNKLNEWIDRGFVLANEQEERDYLEERRAKIVKAQQIPESEKGVYLATVSEGGADGYSVASKNIIRELEKLGLMVSTHYTGQKVAILFHNPYSIPRIEAPYRIIYTMFESTKIPNDWIDYLQAADEVWTPTRWCQSVFAESGIKSEVVPLGYDETTYTPIKRRKAEDTRRDFVFLHYNAFNIRKGFPEVFKAFTQEFKKDEPVKLILKTILTSSPLPITKTEYPNIDIIYGKLTDKEMRELCTKSDCFVFPSRGEGFGMTPLETMATGMSAIVPNAHGISEYFDPEYMYEAKVGEECPALYTKYRDQDVGKMVICDVKDLQKKMRWVYEHQEANLKMGVKASKYVKKWTIQNTAKDIFNRVNEIMLKPLEHNKLKNVLTLEQVR